MRLEHIVTKIPGLPPPEGAHQLVWSYLLDAVCADAYHAGVQLLRVALPSSLASELEARTVLAPLPTTTVGGQQKTASFGLAASRDSDLRSYRLRFGLLAPPSLRGRAFPASSQSADFDLSSSLFVYTLRTRLLGIPMRLFNLLRQPLVADRALIGLRHEFTSERPTTCYYILEIWSRSKS